MDSIRSFDKLRIAANQNPEEKRYWHTKMSGDLEKSIFARDNKVPALDIGKYANIKKYGELPFVVNRGLCEKLLKLSKDSDLKLFMVLAAGLVAVIYRYTGKQDIIIGSTITKQEVEIDFINTVLPLRNQIDETTSFKELLLQTRQTILEANEHQNYPVEVLIEDLNMKFSKDDFPLFDTLIILKNIQEQKYIRNISYNMLFCFSKTEGNLDGVIRYNTIRYNRAGVNKLLEQYLLLLEEMLTGMDAKISGIEILTPEERERVLYAFNNTGMTYLEGKVIHELFEDRVKESADNTAILFDDTQLSYCELDRKARRLSRHLSSVIKAHTVAAVMVEPSIEMIIGILGILKAGGVFLPIDANLPAGRKEFMLQDSGAEILLTAADSPGLVDYPVYRINLEDKEIYESDDPGPDVYPDPGSPAYIIYTSGTSGRPKGVVVEHRNVVAYLQAFYRRFDITAKDVIVQNSSYSFDIFIEELFTVLIKGGKIAIPTFREKEDFYLLYDYIDKVGANILDCTPLLLKEINNLEMRSGIRIYISGGDILKKEYITNLLKSAAVYNTYGPTETTICAAYHKCSHRDMEKSSIPIGKPIANYNIYILDKGGRLLPPGIPGELCIAGAGVTRGYLNNSELTAEKFLNDASGGHPSHLTPYQRLYHSGDLACWLPDGNIEFLGRLDSQVNIRGYRIELKEIESRLVSHKDIKEAVLVEKKEDENSFLCAYYIPGKEIGKAELLEFMSKRLPGYMVPTFFVPLEKFPLTPAGKIDVDELKMRDIPGNAGFAAPRNEIEKKLVDIWSNVLKIEQDTLSIDDNFFELGGHSLKATLLVANIHRELDVRVPLIEVFRYQTIRELSQYIDDTESEKFISIAPVEMKEYYVVSPDQERLYDVQRLYPDSTVYNLAFGFFLGKDLEVERIKELFAKLVTRHEILRSAFETTTGRVWQKIYRKVEFQVECYRETGQNSPDRPVEKIIKDFRRPFDLSKAPLMRVGLIETTGKNYTIMLDFHRIIIDDACIDILTRELIALYSGENPPFLKIQYKDYCAWKNKLMSSEEIKRQEKYWLKLYEGNVPFLRLKPDSTEADMRDFASGRIFLEIPEGLTLIIKREILKHGSNINVFLTVFSILLAKLSGRPDVIVGCPVSGRTHIDLQDIIGMFLNILPLRNRPADHKTYREFLEEVKENTLQAYENQDYPFAELVKQVQFEKDGRQPFVHALLVVLEREESPAGTRDRVSSPDDIARPGNNALPGKAEIELITEQTMGIKSEHDLEIWISEAGSRMSVTLLYAAHAFEKSTAERILGLYYGILGQVLKNENILLKDIEMSTEIPTGPVKVDTRIPKKKKRRFLPGPRKEAAAKYANLQKGVNDKRVRRWPKRKSLPEEKAARANLSAYPVLIKDSKNRKNNLFFIHDISGFVGVYFELCSRLNLDFNLWGIRIDSFRNPHPVNLDIESIAAIYIKIIKEVQPDGPYYFSGWSFGGILAFEIVRQMEKEGELIEFLGIIDTIPPDKKAKKNHSEFSLESELKSFLHNLQGKEVIDTFENAGSIEELWEMAVVYFEENFHKGIIWDNLVALDRDPTLYAQMDTRDIVFHSNGIRSLVIAQNLYIPSSKLKTQVSCFAASRSKQIKQEEWSRYCKKPVKCYRVIGGHESIFKVPHVIKFAETFESVFNKEFNEMDNEYFSTLKYSDRFGLLDMFEKIINKF